MSYCDGGKNTYKRAAAIGSVGEQAVGKVMAGAGLAWRRNPEKADRRKMIEWDVEVDLPGRQVRVEVKFDAMEAKTGNVAVEYYNVKQGKPSGLLATTSDVWVFVLSDLSVWACQTASLRDWFHAKPAHREISCGGDDNAAMKLYRRDELFPALFTRLDAMPPAKLPAALLSLLGDAPANS